MTFDQWIQSDDGKVTEQAAITTREKMRTAYAAGSAEVDQLRVKMASPDGLLSYTEIRNRLLESEIENSELKAANTRIAAQRDHFTAEVEKLRVELRDAYNVGGQCRVLSQGDKCECPKCRAERAEAELKQLRAEMASPDGLLYYDEIRARLLKREIENSRLKVSLNLVAVERDRFAADAYRLRAEADQVKADSRRDATFRRTVDGITVTDGMRLFGVHLETKEVFEWRATVYYAFYEVRSIRNTDDFYVFHVQDCYSTREAAEAAKGAADGNVSPV